MPSVNEEIASRNYALAHGLPYDAYGNPAKAPVMWGGAAAPAVAPKAGGNGTVVGADPTGYNPASGGVPNLTGSGTSLQNLINSIGGNLGGVESIVRGLTDTQNKALKDQYTPEYFGLLDTATANAQKRAGGDITDLLPELNQHAAEAAVAGGVPGSQAYNSKLLRDMGLSRYNVERGALDDLTKIKSATPTVAPYDPNNLVPNINQQLTLQQLADMLKSSPIPEAAYSRGLQNAMAGLSQGGAAGYGGGFSRPNGPGNQSASDPSRIVDRYNPTKPGSGGSFTSQGGFGNDEWDDPNQDFNLDTGTWDPHEWGVPAGGGGGGGGGGYDDWGDDDWSWWDDYDY